MKISTKVDFTAENLLKWKEIVFLYSEKLNSTKICQAFQPKRVGKSKIIHIWELENFSSVQKWV